MQDPLTSSFRWGETFDTAPYCGSPHPDERFTEEKSTELAKREKNFAFYLHVNLKSKGLHVSNL